MRREAFCFITSMNGRIAQETGAEMLRSLGAALPDRCSMVNFAEPDVPAGMLLGPYFGTCPITIDRTYIPGLRWLQQLRAEGETRPIIRGTTERGYDFRYDAVKFGAKVAAFCEGVRRVRAQSGLGGQPRYAVWVDADVMAHRSIPPGWLESLLPPPGSGLPIGWLDRSARNLYPECGFVIVDTAHPAVPLIFEAFERAYASGFFRRYPEWHDSFIFQQLVQQSERSVGSPLTYSLSGEWGRHPHPFVNSDLGKYFDHGKGPKRKIAGGSFRSDLAWDRPEEYWRKK